MVIQLNVQSPTGEDQLIKLCDTEEQMKQITVEELKRIIGKELMTDDPLKLVFANRTLEEKTRLISYNIRHMSTIQAILQLPGGI